MNTLAAPRRSIVRHHPRPAMPEPSFLTAATILKLCAFAGIPITAAAGAAVNPAPDSFTMMGAALAVACVVFYMVAKDEERKQRNEPGRLSKYAVIFNVIATAVIGWVFPELIAHNIFRLDDLSNKSWTALAFVCGLAGGSFVQACINKFKTKVPESVEWAVDRVLPHDEHGAPEGADTKHCRTHRRDTFFSKPTEPPTP